MAPVKLSDDEVDARLDALPDWSRPGEEIQRTYRFKDFVEAMAFVAKVADRARCADHRNLGVCADACSSRVACPLGSEHADHAGEDVRIDTARRGAI
ncbi:MAG: 4a-hydroxytetrahydrobiopterin dehydratase, partial [Phycisphaerales bacterium]